MDTRYTSVEDFNRTKDTYTKFRKQELELIKSYIKEKCDDDQKKYYVSNNNAVGNYKSGGLNKNGLAEKYNLENWLYFVVTNASHHFLISLQAFDRDPTSHNIHVLYDQIGIYPYTEELEVTINDNDGNQVLIKEALTKMFLTDIGLPMDDTKLEKLVKYIKDIDENWDDRTSIIQNHGFESNYRLVDFNR